MRRGLAVATLALAGAAAVAPSCAEPLIVEESALGCSNGRDDDGDGDTDCEDADCDASGVCETTAPTCSNGIDDDEDGATDCEESACVEGGFCVPFTAACSLVPQAGCPAGMGCYPLEDVGTECRLAGEAQSGTSCDGAQGLEPNDCAAGFTCALKGSCLELCLWDVDCPRATRCVRGDALPYGFCSLSCHPLPGLPACPEETDCISFHSFGFSFDSGGALWTCLPPPVAFEGEAQLGDPCDDNPVIDALDRVCAAPSACAPDAFGDYRCRKVCALAADDGSPIDGLCPSDEECVTFYPLDLRPLPAISGLVLGACLSP